MTDSQVNQVCATVVILASLGVLLTALILGKIEGDQIFYAVMGLAAGAGIYKASKTGGNSTGGGK